MTGDPYTSRWLFRLLDYEHYAVDDPFGCIGMVIINHADQDVIVSDYDTPGELVRVLGDHGYTWWRTWLREHELDGHTS